MAVHTQYKPGVIPENAVLIIGAGCFGKRAARILVNESDIPILIVDRDEKRLEGIEVHRAERILGEGIDFLVKNIPLLRSSVTIIPAIPHHVAFEWLKGSISKGYNIRQIAVPKEIESLFTHAWPGSDGSLLVSYADFICPEDCPEPPAYCTVTGQEREIPMFEKLRTLETTDFRRHILRSRQLAPGLGGYVVGELTELLNNLEKQETGKWLVGTACRCHGIVTAMELSAD
ncbi:NAD-binding protein [Thermodesulfobacteriota bacterium]